MLGQIRGAEGCPWSEKQLGLDKVISPQMANWLPAEEAAALRREFAAEVAGPLTLCGASPAPAS
jgi:hypothetical protein